MKRVCILAVVAFIFWSFLHPTVFTASPHAAPAAQAFQNLFLDPTGRVVDVVFEPEVTLTAPWDRFHFAIDIVQPLARDSGAFLSDITEDGVLDLILATFEGATLFYPGLPGNPRTFGDGILLQHITTQPSEDPFRDAKQSAVWTTGDVGDLDGDGNQEIIVGQEIFTNVGTPSVPKLQLAYLFGPPLRADPAASVGDLNHDGKLDIVISYNYSNGSLIYWNNSTPGAFQFTEQLLHKWPMGEAPRNRLKIADFNGDGLLDLSAVAGIYWNTGTAQTPQFDFTAPTAWHITGGPSWKSESDQGANVFLQDVNGDGLLDAYVSNLSSTVWQVLFYQNVGTVAAHHLAYIGPVVVKSTPLDTYYRGDTLANWNGNHVFVASGDIDQNGRPDILLSDNDGNTSGAPTILWNFSSEPGAALEFSYQDLYTYPPLDAVKEKCGPGAFGSPDALCAPPNLFSAWTDLTGDGLPDALRTDQWLDAYMLYRQKRTGAWPFTLEGQTALNTTPSHTQATGWGVALVDVDTDGQLDLVTGTEDGRLLYYRNTGTAGTFADPVALTDTNGVPLDVGQQSWPAAFDLDGDGDLDLLVTNAEGVIYQVFCSTPGTPKGYTLGNLLAAAEQNPIDVTYVTGGGSIVPSLTTADVDHDGLSDILMGNADGRVWLLQNRGTATVPAFSLGPLLVTRTAAAYLEMLDSHRIRLYFALPTTPGQTILAFDQLPTTGSPLSGEVVITDAPTPTVTPTDTDTPTITPTLTNTPTPISVIKSSVFLPLVYR